MLKQKRAMPRLAKVAMADGTVVVDVESGLLVGGSTDVERERTRSLSERRSQPPPSAPSSEPSRH
jgi:hypothetical protein